MLTYKKKIILALLEKLGERAITAKSFQKFLFLFTRRSGNKVYEFVPYRYGCFSFEANKDVYALAKSGYLEVQESENSESVYKLLYHNSDVIQNLNIFDNIELDKIVKDFGKLSTDELITYTYRKYPYTAINSAIKQNLLNHEELEKVEKERRRYLRDSAVLYTIGYEGISLEKYLNLLLTNDVKILVDVRKNAFSMKYGFSKATLQKAVEGIGLKYIHVPQLGIESEDRQSLNTQADYDRLFDVYKKTTLKNNWYYVLQVRKLLDENQRICLTCFERDPRQCHRTMIANALMSLNNVYYKYEPIIL